VVEALGDGGTWPYQQCHELLALLLDSIDVARLFGSSRLTMPGWE
jgi:hypothetical protein